ncbi:hypothetical protein [Streptomyces siamensis]
MVPHVGEVRRAGRHGERHELQEPTPEQLSMTTLPPVFMYEYTFPR